MSSAPDTRNKLDGKKDNKTYYPNSNNNTDTPKKPSFRKASRAVTIGDLQKALTMDTSIRKIDIPSKGKLFKIKRGFSKSLKRAMQHADIVPIAANLSVYRTERKYRKLDQKKVRQRKHQESVAFKLKNGKKKQSKGKKKESTVKEAA